MPTVAVVGYSIDIFVLVVRRGYIYLSCLRDTSQIVTLTISCYRGNLDRNMAYAICQCLNLQLSKFRI